MDITKIEDIVVLKVMHYDQLVMQEQAQNNLRMINQQIARLESELAKSNKTPKD